MSALPQHIFSPPMARRIPANDGIASHQAVYRRLLDHDMDAAANSGSREWLDARLCEARQLPCALPESPADLSQWMLQGSAEANAAYQQYLSDRKAGAPRRFFGNRSHALAFLRGVAPTKLVDGSWLHGVLRHWTNPRYADLVRTYVEELGDGRADRNHVLLYRQLLASHGIDASPSDLPDDRYTQGAIQLARRAGTGTGFPACPGRRRLDRT
jgi:hypothetical protein